MKENFKKFSNKLKLLLNGAGIAWLKDNFFSFEKKIYIFEENLKKMIFNSSIYILGLAFSERIIRVIYNFLPKTFYDNVNYQKRVFWRKALFLNNKYYPNEQLSTSYIFFFTILTIFASNIKKLFNFLYNNFPIYVEKEIQEIYIFENNLRNILLSEHKLLINSVFEEIDLLRATNWAIFFKKVLVTIVKYYNKNNLSFFIAFYGVLFVYLFIAIWNFFKEELQQFGGSLKKEMEEYDFKQIIKNIKDYFFFFFFYCYKYIYLLLNWFFHYIKLSNYIYIFILLIVTYMFNLSLGFILSISVVFVFSFILKKFIYNKIHYKSSAESDLLVLEKFIINFEKNNEEYSKKNYNEILASLILFYIMRRKRILYFLHTQNNG